MYIINNADSRIGCCIQPVYTIHLYIINNMKYINA
uniref:Uncharacterized protein n=1 Tax=Myoviridae sp. ctNQV2 TaxID=2827683 RepID=A0A8S5RYL1_9CAUD|nr:MAG TPA: hypothetical protein [Myoviridae sp. ctNQV2]